MSSVYLMQAMCKIKHKSEDPRTEEFNLNQFNLSQYYMSEISYLGQFKMNIIFTSPHSFIRSLELSAFPGFIVDDMHLY